MVDLQASASILSRYLPSTWSPAMTPETEAQIRSVRKFGTYAHSLSTLAAVLLVIYFVVWEWSIASGALSHAFKVGLGGYSVMGDQLTTIQLKVWAMVVVATGFAIFFAVVFHVRRLFSRLAAGSIYRRENVHTLRRVGILALAMAVLQFVLP